MKKQKAIAKPSSRPPVVVILGHVDHGKTTLLDFIRQSNLASREAGQITQHIGAYQIKLRTKDKELRTITFIDTPGHEAFAKMRSRGASVADIAVLVVAADDGVMPQTKEAIRHIKKAQLPLMVAINKIDLPEVNEEKIKKQLVKEGVALEGYGGDVVAMPISAKTGKGVNELLEMILLVAEMGKLEGDPGGPLQAVVIEAKMDRHRGPIASILVKNGTLRQGDEVFVENIKGKARAIVNDRGERLNEASLSDPVEILGLEETPTVGAILTREPVKEEKIEASKESAEQEGVPLKIIFKADVLGTLEAIISSLSSENLRVILSGTGDVSDSDVLLAKTTGAMIIGFNVRVSSSAVVLAETEAVKIKVYELIYELLEEIKEVAKAFSQPIREESLGKAEIIAEFPFNKGKIAGCRVIEGRLATNDWIKLLREEKEINQSKIKSLKQQKESVNKIELGKEGGVLFDPPLDFAIGDSIIAYKPTK